MSNVAEALRALVMPLADLNLDGANARVHDAKNLAAIKASLKRFGQRLPIVVQREGMVVRAGNGRVEAARELGWDEIAAVVVDESDVEATAFAIADNRTSELAEWDDEVLAQTLKGLEGDGVGLDELGFSDDDLAALVGDVEAPELFPEVDETLATESECPKCGYQWSGGKLSVGVEDLLG